MDCNFKSKLFFLKIFLIFSTLILYQPLWNYIWKSRIWIDHYKEEIFKFLKLQTALALFSYGQDVLVGGIPSANIAHFI